MIMKFTLSGDLNQMGIQRRFLSNLGYIVTQMDVYPCLEQVDKKDALTAIWHHKVEGWWHYKEEYVELGICTEEEYKARF